MRPKLDLKDKFEFFTQNTISEKILTEKSRRCTTYMFSDHYETSQKCSMDQASTPKKQVLESIHNFFFWWAPATP